LHTQRLAIRPVPLLSDYPGLLAAGALFFSLVVGVLTARHLPQGMGLVAGLLYAPLVLLNLPVAIALFVALVGIERLTFVDIAPSAAMCMIAFAWFGTVRSRQAEFVAQLRQHRPLLTPLALLVLWILLSLTWAPQAGGLFDPGNWYIAAAIMVVLVTAIHRERHVQLVVAGFVGGALLSVVIGLADNGLTAEQTAIESATADEGRLAGGSGDPNYLAAGLIPAIVLSGGLAATTRNPVLRWGLAVTAGILAVGLAATQSRGGLVAAGVVVVAALLFFRGQRMRGLAFVALVLSVAGVWFATSPEAFDRITSIDRGGTGRAELWRIAGRVIGDHAVVGAGFGSFESVAPRYVREPGQLRDIGNFVERPRVVHNAYLQMMAEIGAVGLALYLLVALGSVVAAFRAGRLFERAGDPSWATCARAIGLAALGAMASSVFLSNATDKRSWILFSLGPALLALAARRVPTRPT